MEFSEEHAPGILLHVIKFWKEKDKSFTESRDYSLEFQTSFLNAWKVLNYMSNSSELVAFTLYFNRQLKLDLNWH